jgi:DNA-binding protein Fis
MADQIDELIAHKLQQGDKDIYRTVIQTVDRLLLPEVIKQHSGNQSAASEFLGLSRMTLRSKLRSLGMLK